MMEDTCNKAEEYLQQLGQLAEEIEYIRHQLTDGLKNYRKSFDIQSEVDLHSSIAYFEKHLLPFIISRQSRERHSDNADILTTRIDGSWKAYEFRQFFDGIDFLNRLYTIQSKLEKDSPELDKRNRPKRSTISGKGQLASYMTSDEEIRVPRIQFGSPGLIYFEGTTEVIREMYAILEYIVTYKWVKEITVRYDQFGNERSRRESTLKKVLQQMRQQDRQWGADNIELYYQGINRLNQIADLAIELNRRRLAFLRSVEDTFITSISALHRLGYEEEKLKIGPLLIEG